MENDAVITALRSQLDCYRKLAKLAEIQHEHVRQGRTEQLLDVLGARQSVLKEIADYEHVIAPAKRQWEDYAAKLTTEGRQEAEALLAETRALLERITSADRDDALVLQQRKLNIGKQIQQATSARQINKTYATAAYGRRPSRMDVQH